MQIFWAFFLVFSASQSFSGEYSSSADFVVPPVGESASKQSVAPPPVTPTEPVVPVTPPVPRIVEFPGSAPPAKPIIRSSSASASSAAPPAQEHPPITAPEATVLLREFRKAQGLEIKALEHQHAFQLKEKRQAFEIQKREKQRISKEGQFSSKEFLAEWAEVENKENELFKQRLVELKTKQQENLKEFEKFIGEGKRPPITLWP